MTRGEQGVADREAAEALCRAVRCPVVVVQGTADEMVPPERGARVAELTGGRLVVLEGSGHLALVRDPVGVNLLLRDVACGPRMPARWARPASQPRRALVVSSPIGLGHAWRDVRIADELRRRVPGLVVEWLAQEPVTSLLAARGETIHPASAELASEAGHIDARGRRAPPPRVRGDPPDGRDPLRELHAVLRRRARHALRPLDRRRGVGARRLPPREPGAEDARRSRG